MNTQTISIDLPYDIFLALNETESEIKQRIKISLAIRFYKLQKNPTHIAHICKLHKPTHNQNLQKSAIFPSHTKK